MTRKDRIKYKERRVRRLAKEQQQREELATREELLEKEVGEQVPPASEPDGGPENVEKEYGEPMGMMMPMGPTSFEELDAERQAREKAEQIRDVTWDVQDLVRNILNSMHLAPEEKAKKIQDVASGFEERVADAMAEEEMEKDMELLELEALVASVERQAPLLQKAWDFVKEEVSYATKKGKPDSSFALVYTDENGNKVRKYLVHDASHVRNALARAVQQMKGGGPGAADAKRAMPKIRAAAKKFGIEMSKAFHIEKDAKGDWRWIGWPATNFLDRQNDIMSKSAHRKYCDWLDANPEMAPMFVPWHSDAPRTYPVDFWGEHEGALIMSGKLTEGEAGALFEVMKETDLGMSLKGYGLRLNPGDQREITDYFLYEVTDLPLENAANLTTNLDLVEPIAKEASMDELQYLTKIWGSEEKAQAYLERTGKAMKKLRDEGHVSKEAGGSNVQKEEAAQKVEEAAPPTLDVEALIKRFKEEFKIDDLNAFVAQAQEDHEKVSILEGVVKELRQSDDEKLAQQLTPPAVRLAWARDNRVSQSEDSKLKKSKGQEEDKTLSKAAPGVPDGYWLSEVTGTAPIVQEV